MVKVVHTEAFNGFSHMRSTLLSALQNAIHDHPVNASLSWEPLVTEQPQVQGKALVVSSENKYKYQRPRCLRQGL